MEIAGQTQGTPEPTATVSTDGGDAGVVNSEESRKDTIKKALTSVRETDHSFQDGTETPDNSTSAPDSQPNSEAVDDDAPSNFTAPASWTADAKEAFYSLPDNLQEQVVKRETDLRRHLSTKGEELKKSQERYSELDATFSRNQARFDAMRVSPDQFLRNAVAWDDAFRDDPMGAWLETGKNYGIDVDALLRSNNTNQQQSPRIPQEILSKLSQLEEEVSGFKSHTQAANVSQIESQITKWREETTSDNELRRPFAEMLEAEMEDLLPAVIQRFKGGDMTLWLDKAYEAACALSDDVKIKQRALAAKQTITDAQKRVAQAKKASAGLSHDTNKPIISEAPTDRREMIKQELQRWRQNKG